MRLLVMWEDGRNELVVRGYFIHYKTADMNEFEYLDHVSYNVTQYPHKNGTNDVIYHVTPNFDLI